MPYKNQSVDWLQNNGHVFATDRDPGCLLARSKVPEYNESQEIDQVQLARWCVLIYKTWMDEFTQSRPLTQQTLEALQAKSVLWLIWWTKIVKSWHKQKKSIRYPMPYKNQSNDWLRNNGHVFTTDRDPGCLLARSKVPKYNVLQEFDLDQMIPTLILTRITLEALRASSVLWLKWWTKIVQS